MAVRRILCLAATVLCMVAWGLTVAWAVVGPVCRFGVEGDSVVTKSVGDLILLWMLSPTKGALFGMPYRLWLIVSCLYVAAFVSIKRAGLPTRENDGSVLHPRLPRAIRTLVAALVRGLPWVVLVYAVIALLAPLCVWVCGPTWFETLREIKTSGGGWILFTRAAVLVLVVFSACGLAAILLIPVPAVLLAVPLGINRSTVV